MHAARPRRDCPYLTQLVEDPKARAILLAYAFKLAQCGLPVSDVEAWKTCAKAAQNEVLSQIVDPSRIECHQTKVIDLVDKVDYVTYLKNELECFCAL